MVTVAELLETHGASWKLSLLTGASALGNVVSVPRIQKPGLAFAGYIPQIHPERVQVVGNTELSYLRTLSAEDAARAVERVFTEPITCVIVTNGAMPPEYLVAAAARHEMPLITTPLKSSELIRGLTAWLEDRLAPHTLLHGVLVEVHGLGVLLHGKSGIGKSEAALDLITRGHRLVADDVVEVRSIRPGVVIGRGAELIRNHMEIRGLGIINVQDLFGILATMHQKEIELVAEMIEWSSEDPADRLGLEEDSYEILGVPVPMVRIPIRPGRSIATIIEVAARNHVLKRLGHHTAREFSARLDDAIARRRDKARVEAAKREEQAAADPQRVASGGGSGTGRA